MRPTGLGSLGLIEDGGKFQFGLGVPFDPTPDSLIRTLHILGFPADASDREIFNLLRCVEDRTEIPVEQENIVFVNLWSHS
jgi:hypothetical protein